MFIRATWTHMAFVATAAVSILSITPHVALAGDWPTWRGLHRDGISSAEGLLDRWPIQGPPLSWKIEGLGAGYSSLAIADERIFTLGHRGGDAALLCLNLKDGGELWSASVGPGEPNCTPTVDDGRVYALGREGDLVCADAKTGRELWRKHLQHDFGGRMMSGWGYSESPLIDGERLICTPGGDAAVLVALDKHTGDVIWKASAPSDAKPRGADGAGYSSVVLSHACGVRQYVQLTGRGLISVAADDGTVLWSYNDIANGTANIPTPIVDGDYVFCSSGYGTGAALLKLVARGHDVIAEEVYFLPAKTLQNHHGGMVLVDGHIYCGHGHNQGFPICIEMKTGEVAWRGGRGPGSGSAAVLHADGHLYFRYEDGLVALIETRPDKYVLVGTFRPATVNGKGWPHPVIADGRLYLRDQGTLLCYDVRE